MKAMLPALAAVALLVNVAARDKQTEGCTVSGWTDGSWTRPIFKCPDGSK